MNSQRFLILNICLPPSYDFPLNIFFKWNNTKGYRFCAENNISILIDLIEVLFQLEIISILIEIKFKLFQLFQSKY